LKSGHGNVNVTHALEQSCNIFFYKLGMALGIDKIAKYARAFGLGARTGIQVPNEVAGLIPDSEWKQKVLGEEWQAGETLSNTIGQGFVLATPIQMATAYSSIANSGPVFRPHVLKRIIDVDGKVIKEIEPELKADTSKGINTEVKISPEVFSVVREGLRLVSNGSRGTAGRSRIPGLEYSGKTGTSQLFQLTQDQVYAKCANRPIQQRHHGWFMGYAPSNDPKIVVAILSEHSCSGSGGAAPVAKEIIKAYLQKYYPDMIKSAVKVGPITNAAPAEVED
jgi:penicillin-binding protein 2